MFAYSLGWQMCFCILKYLGCSPTYVSFIGSQYLLTRWTNAQMSTLDPDSEPFSINEKGFRIEQLLGAMGRWAFTHVPSLLRGTDSAFSHGAERKWPWARLGHLQDRYPWPCHCKLSRQFSVLWGVFTHLPPVLISEFILLCYVIPDLLTTLSY